MKHPRFHDIAAAINAAIADVASQFDISDSDLEGQRPLLDRVADDMARAMMKAWDVNHS